MIYFISNQKLVSNKFETINDISIVTKYLKEIPEEEKMFTLDTETTGLDPYTSEILLVQVGDSKDQYVIDARLESLKEIFPFIEDQTFTKILANAKFDYKQLLKHYNIRINNIFDVLTADRIIYNGMMGLKEESMYKKEHGHGRFSLAGLAMKYLKKYMPKEERNSFVNHKGDFTEAQVIYAAGDIDIPYLIKPLQDVVLKKYSLSKLCYEIENPVIAAFSEMELSGMYLNPVKWDIIGKQNIALKEKLAYELDEAVVNDPILAKKFKRDQQLGMFGVEGRKCIVKWSSSPQKIKVLKELGLDLWVIDKETKMPKESVDINVLTKYKNEHKLVSTLIDYSKVSKNVSSYGKKFLRHVNPVTNRVHTSIFAIKETGRTGSGDPNLQNIPAETSYRKAFEALGDNRTFIVIDYSNMELRMIAEKSGEKTLIDAFLKGEDVHSSMAMMIQKVVYGKDVIVSKYENSHLRTESKTITFLIAYGGSEYRLKDVLNISIEEAKNLIDSYFLAFPKLKEFTQSLQDFGIKKGYIRTFKPYSRLRWFPTHKEFLNLNRIWEKTDTQKKRMMSVRGEIMRAASNTPIQGSAADIMKKACVMMNNRLIEFSKDNNIYGFDNPNRPLLCMQIHDEMIIECNIEHAKQLSEDAAFLMERAAADVMEVIPLIAEPNISKEWQK